MHVVRTAVLVLLLGAAINVAVAWGCVLCPPAAWARALWPPVAPVRTEWTAGDLSALVPKEWRNKNANMVHQVRKTFGLCAHRLYVLPEVTESVPASEFDTRRLHVVRAGWPMGALECDTISDFRWNTFRGYTVEAWRGGAAVPRFLGGDVARIAFEVPDPLPLRPIWSGFALNTLLFGAACWTLVSGPCTLRRWRRGRRGLCMGCGYPVAGMGRCPECGREEGVGGAGSDPGATTRRTRSSSP